MPRSTRKKLWYSNIAFWALIIAVSSLVLSIFALLVSYNEYKLNKTIYEEIMMPNTLDDEILSRLNVLDGLIESAKQYITDFKGSVETKVTYTLSLNRAEGLRSEAVSAWMDKRYEESYNLIIEASSLLKDILPPPVTPPQTPPQPTSWGWIAGGIVVGIILTVLTGWMIEKSRETSSD